MKMIVFCVLASASLAPASVIFADLGSLTRAERSLPPRPLPPRAGSVDFSTTAATASPDECCRQGIEAEASRDSTDMMICPEADAGVLTCAGLLALAAFGYACGAGNQRRIPKS